jgi:hypothetical protein
MPPIRIPFLVFSLRYKFKRSMNEGIYSFMDKGFSLSTRLT